MSKKEEVVRNILRVCAQSFVLALTVSVGVNAQIDNIEARIEGPVVVPDTINGLDGMIPAGATVNIVFSMQTTGNWESFTLPFILYSPDGSLDSLPDLDPAVFLPALTDMTDVPPYELQTPDSVLPEEFSLLDVRVAGSIDFPALADFAVKTLMLPVDADGVLCLDSMEMPAPGGGFVFWRAAGPQGTVLPQWGASVGGYADGGLCFTVVPGLNCCQLAGDANHDGSLNIADATFLIAYIFAGGDSPMCCAEGDANGDGMINISDVLYHIAVNFLGGPLPMCGPADLLSCGGM